MNIIQLKKLLFFFVTSLSLITNAQTVQGKLINEDGKPESYANVLLFSASDTVLVRSELSDTVGQFKFKVPNVETTYYINILGLGKKEYKSVNFKGSINLGTITVKQSVNAIGEIEIKGKKPFIEKTGRGMTINVSESPVLANSNTKEVLEKIPGVVVNQDGSLTLKGKSEIQIFIDGKRTNMSQEDLMRLLETMPSSEIERVEVFEIPPAKFDASGTGGIINLVTKKGLRLGLNGNIGVRAGYGNSHKFVPWINANYRNEKLNVFGSTYYYNKIFDHRGTADMKMEIDSDTSSFFNKYQKNHHSIGNGARFGLDYAVTPKVTIGYLTNFYNGRLFGWQPSTVNVTGPQAQNYDFINATQNFDIRWSGHTHNINFQKEFSKDASLNLDVDVAFRKNSRDNDNLNEFYAGSAKLTPFYIEQLGATTNNIAAAKLDYENVLGKHWKIETGLKSSYVKTDNTFKALEGTSSTDATEDLTAANTFKYEEIITAAYFSAVRKWKENWTIDLGVRAENTIANGTSPTTTTSFNKKYLNFFPNVALSYAIPKKYSFSSAFTRRINRPRYYQLNPFQSQTNQFNFHQGNPDLNPQYTNSLNLTYGLLDAFYLTVSASKTQDLMNNVVQQIEEEQRQIHTMENLDKFENYNVNAYIPFTIKKWYQGSINATLYRNKLTSNLDWGVVGYELVSYNISTQHQFKLPKDFSIELSGFYNSDSYWSIWFVEPHYKIDLGFAKKYKDFRFNLALKDIFNIREGNGGLFQDNIQTTTTYKPESRKVILSINYRFGNKNVKGSRNRKTGSEDLQNRSGE